MLSIPRHTSDEDQPKINALFHDLKRSYPHLPEAFVHTLAVAGVTLSEEQLLQILHASDKRGSE